MLDHLELPVDIATTGVDQVANFSTSIPAFERIAGDAYNQPADEFGTVPPHPVLEPLPAVDTGVHLSVPSGGTPPWLNDEYRDAQ